MTDIICLLPDSLANQIAAGEVIQRPASAVKELLENSIDAGSTSIQVVIKDAGKSLIQIIDNGCGMSHTDARMAFERHATSKIKSIDDLFSIKTMGFRGEALASIAAVAQLDIKSRLTGEELGTHLKIEGTEVKSQEPCQCQEGTVISIKNLFFNVPARRNFLKSNPVETRHIIEEFQRIALANQEIFFSLKHNGSDVFHLNPAGLRQRIVDIFGDNYNKKIVPVEESTDLLSVKGFVGKPEYAKKTRGEQYFFINNRYIKSPYLNHSVFNNYESLVPSGSYPFFVLFIDIDPSRIDINVHPTKQEIKFDDEKTVYGILRASIKHALAKFSVTPNLDFEQERSMNDIQFGSSPFSPATPSESSSTIGLMNKQPSIPDSDRHDRNLDHWQKLYDVASNSQENSLTLESGISEQGKLNKEALQDVEREPYQIHGRYILSHIKSGFLIINQQAAHERVLFERYLTSLKNNQKRSQRQLFPKTINCSPSDSILMKEIMADINELGFDIQEFGKDTFLVHGIPADIKEGDDQDVLERLLENYKNNLSVLKLDKRDSLARSLSQQAAIKEGQQLSTKEMKSLIDELFGCEQPYVAPNGKLTFITLDFDELDSRFQQK